MHGSSARSAAAKTKTDRSPPERDRKSRALISEDPDQPRRKEGEAGERTDVFASASFSLREWMMPLAARTLFFSSSLLRLLVASSSSR